MKRFLIITATVLMLFSLSCNNADNQAQQQVLTGEVDSLNSQISQVKPGLGELMLTIQMHHIKLWFAGKSANWALAKFDMDEIREMFKTAQTIETDRPEVKSISMIHPALDSVTAAIQAKDVSKFESSYRLLTNTCNTCHKAVHYPMNKIVVPETSPFTDQDLTETN